MATLTTSSAWADVRLTPEEERTAAEETLRFLSEVSDEAARALAEKSEEAARSLHRVWDFSSFSPATIPF